MGEKMEDKFNLEAIDKTFTTYTRGQMFDGVVVIKREDGCIFNIGGKNDAYLPSSEVEDYENLKIGDRFKVIILNSKNEDGLLEVSKSQADNQIIATQNANKLKLGSKATFVVTEFKGDNLISKMGEYKIVVPVSEMSSKVRDPRRSIGRQYEGIVTEIDRNEKKIIASIKMLEDQIRENNEELFWRSIFINKIVNGKVKKILNYGAFVEVGGIDCFVHISNLSYERISQPSDVIKEGEEYSFKVIEVDRENKKVALSLKALQESPRVKAIKELEIGQVYEGQVIKILNFGAIVKLENGATGLLHIKNATEANNKQIYEIVKLDEKIKVEILDIDFEIERVSFKLVH